MAGIYLLDVEAWTGSAVETLRLSTRTLATKPSDVPANTVYDGRITDAGQLDRSLFADGGISGAPSSSSGAIEFSNADGRLDPWLGYGFDGRPFTLRYLSDPKLPLASAALVMRGSCARIEAPDATKILRLQIRDRLAALSVPLLSARYAGTTTSAGPAAEGDVDLKDQMKPRIFGTVFNVAPKLVNRFNLIYQVSAGPVAAITAYDGAVALTFAGDYPTLAVLVSATVAPGAYATCCSAGLFRLGGAAAFAITADVNEGATAANRSAARVVGRMLDLLGPAATDRDLASFDTVHAHNPAEVGIYVDSDATALDLIGQVLNSIGAGLLPGTTGTLELFAFDAPSGQPVATYTRRELLDTGASLALVGGPSGDGEGIPAWSVIVNHSRVWQVMASGDVAGVVTAERKAYLATVYRQASAQTPATKTAHLLASEITVDSLLTLPAAAQAEAVRRLSLYGVRRDRWAFPVRVEDAAPIGSVVRLKMRRFGYDGGRLFRVIGRTDDFNRRIATLALWG